MRIIIWLYLINVISVPLLFLIEEWLKIAIRMEKKKWVIKLQMWKYGKIPYLLGFKTIEFNDYADAIFTYIQFDIALIFAFILLGASVYEIMTPNKIMILIGIIGVLLSPFIVRKILDIIKAFKINDDTGESETIKESQEETERLKSANDMVFEDIKSEYKPSPCPWCKNEMKVIRITSTNGNSQGYNVIGEHKPGCYMESRYDITYASIEDLKKAWEKYIPVPTIVSNLEPIKPITEMVDIFYINPVTKY